MGNCTGPGHHNGLIYVGFIDQMFSDAQQYIHKLNQQPSDLENGGQLIYKTIKVRLSKKGLMKKLADHLSSHRNFIIDSTQHIFRIMRQKKTLLARTTGLVIVDHLVSTVEEYTTLAVRSRNNSAHHYDSIKSTKSFTSEAMSQRDIDIRFQTIYFKIFLQLHQVEAVMRPVLLNSLQGICEKRKTNFSCDQLVNDALNLMLDQINRRKNLVENVQAFNKLLEKSHQNAQDQQSCQESLKVFMNLWVSVEGEQIQKYCADVIRTYINRCVTAREYIYIYATIFQLYDQCCFREEQIGNLENKLLNVIQDQDLRDQFLKGLMRYMMTYLSLCDSSQVRRRWQDCSLEISFQAIKSLYPNITHVDSKKNGFLTLQKWLRRNLVNLNQLITYNRGTFVYCFIFNIFSYLADRAMTEYIVKIFFQTVRACEVSCVAMIFEILLDELFKTNQKLVREGTVIYKMARRCLDDHDFFQAVSSDHYQNFLRPIFSILPAPTKSQILDIYCSIIGSTKQDSINEQLFEAVCRVLQSLYDCLMYRQTIRQKYMFVCPSICLFKQLYRKHEQEILIAFVDRLIECQREVVSYAEKYMCRLLSYQIYGILTNKELVPSQMQHINQKITAGDEQQVLQLVNIYIQGNKDWQNVPQNVNVELMRKEANKKKIEMIKKYIDRINKQSYRESEIGVDTRITVRKKNSTMIERQSSRGDQSFQQIYGLIKEQHNGEEQRLTQT